MTQLKPCPFCGAVPDIYDTEYENERGTYFFIICNNEKCRIQPTTDWHKCKSVVVREWNRRAGDE